MASFDATRCQYDGCLNFVYVWCHARCCSGETGLCRLHWHGSRHERELFYEQIEGEMLPTSRADCAAALARQEARIAAELRLRPALVTSPDGFAAVRAVARNDAHERRLAELRFVADLLRRELATFMHDR